MRWHNLPSAVGVENAVAENATVKAVGAANRDVLPPVVHRQ